MRDLTRAYFHPEVAEALAGSFEVESDRQNQSHTLAGLALAAFELAPPYPESGGNAHTLPGTWFRPLWAPQVDLAATWDQASGIDVFAGLQLVDPYQNRLIIIKSYKEPRLVLDTGRLLKEPRLVLDTGTLLTLDLDTAEKVAAAQSTLTAAAKTFFDTSAKAMAAYVRLG